MTLCKVCCQPDCLGPGTSGNRDGKRCIGTIDTECSDYPVPEERLEEIVEYQLECFRYSRQGLPLNGRILLSLIKELRELRNHVENCDER